MKGFMKRDLYLMLPNLKVYALFVVLVVGLHVFHITDSLMSFFGFYISLFAASSILGLFSYDDMNRWQPYAAAVPDGRRGQVDGRYAAALLLGGGVAVTLAFVDFAAVIYVGMFLLYIDVAIPVSYRFGLHSRTAMIVIIAVLGGVMGGGGATLVISAAGGTFQGRSPELMVGLPLLALGLVGMVLSRNISLKILAGKEL